MTVYPYIVAAWLLGIGLYGVITSRNYVHVVICLTVMQASTYILLLSVGYVGGGKAPIFADIPTTSVVVEATVVALLLALVIQANKRYRTVDPDRMNRMHD